MANLDAYRCFIRQYFRVLQLQSAITSEYAICRIATNYFLKKIFNPIQNNVRFFILKTCPKSAQ